MSKKLEAAIEEENARQSLRENQRAGKATDADVQRVKDAQKAYDKAK